MKCDIEEIQIIKLGNMPQVENMRGRTGGKIPNQFEIQTDKGLFFQSYSTLIVALISNKTYLNAESWDCSNTTGKYRNQFLNETKKETEAKIKSGEYILARFER